MIDVAKSVLAWREQGQRVALAVVVSTWGSAPREVGSMMAVSESGQMTGSVSGGCIEGSIAFDAQTVMQMQQPCLSRFSTSNDKAWEVGAPCGGDIEVLVLPYDDELHGFMMQRALMGAPFTFFACLDGIASAEDLMERASSDMQDAPTSELGRSESRFDLSGGGRFFPFQGAQGVVCPDGSSECHWMEPFFLDETIDEFRSSFPQPNNSKEQAETWGRAQRSVPGGEFVACGARMFGCRYLSRPTLVLVGAVHIAACMADIAKTCGYRVIVVDPRRAFLTKERFPQADELLCEWPQQALGRLHIDGSTAVCALTHDPKIDVPALAAALETDAGYIGCLGHAETLLDRKRALEELGFRDDQMARVFGPIGLWIGGRTPADIALSAMAQIQAVRNGRIDHGNEMPGKRLDYYTQESVSAIAAQRTSRPAPAGRNVA